MSSSSPRLLNLLTVRKPQVLLRFIGGLVGAGAVPVLDLEDGLWDVIDPGRTAALKARGRLDLGTLASSPALEGVGLGVRVNRVADPEFQRDLVALQKITQGRELECIVGTKVESPNDLSAYLGQLEGAGVRFREFIPIVETRAGLSALEAIAASAAKAGIRAVLYGYFDYSLDAGHWPFAEPEQIGYWQIVDDFVARVEKAGLDYIHPPFFQIFDNRRLEGICRRLEQTCSRPFGMLTVSGAQVQHLAGLKPPGDHPAVLPPLGPGPAYGADELARLAVSVKSAYEERRGDDKGFAVEPGTGWFISPHLYLAALAFLRKNDGLR